MSDNTELLIEANKRGLLTGKYQSLYDDAVKNGIIKVEKPENEQGLFLDSVDSFQAGALSGMGGMFDFVGAEGMAKSLYDWSDDQQKTMSESGKKALSKQFVVEDENGDIALGEGAKDLDTWILTMANVAGQFAGTAVPGGAAARAVTKVASLGARGSKAATVAGMGATGGSAATGQGMEQARKEVESMPDDILGDSPMFIKTLREIHSSNPELSGAEKWDLAKKEISDRVAQDVRTDPKVLIANFGASAIGDPIIGKALVGARLAKSGALKSSLAGFATEGATEAVQAGTQQYGINEALQPLDNRDAMDGVVTAGLNEGLAGAGFGGIAGGIGGVANRGNTIQDEQPSTTLPDDETTPRIDENEGVKLPDAIADEIAIAPRSEAASKFQSASSDIVSNGVEQLVGTGFTKEQAIEAVKAYQYQAAIKKGLSEREASLVVAQTMKDKFDIDDPILAMPEPAQEQTIPDDNVTPQLEDDANVDVDYDAPTAARQAGFDQTAKAAGQYGDMLTSPAQQSLKALDEGNNAPTVDERVKAAAFDKSPTPDDRFSPTKYTHEGELLAPESNDTQGIENSPIDGKTTPVQGKLPTTEQTQSRQMREQAQADLESQPKSIEQKDIIFGEDGRPQQRAAERVKQAGKDSQNLLPQKDIVFADNESGVNVAKSGEPFKTKRDALLSKEARAARRAGQKTKAVSFDNGFGWTVKDNAQSSAPSTAPDISADNQQTEATLTDEGTIPQSTESNIESNAQPTANLAGDPIDGDWTAFNEQSETKSIPRSDMPQIKAENRGAMVNFMKARDISHEQDEVPASSLKPTQQEFSPAKVKKAMEFEGGNRSILVSNDNYVLDGHHQWLAAREKDEPVKVIRLNAPIEQLVPLAKEMPSTETQDSQTVTNEQNSVIPEQKLENSEQDAVNPEQSAELPPILKTTKRKWLQSQAKEQGLKKGSPGFDVAMAKIEESYEPAIDKALAESSFETYQEFNSDTPESINRQAYNELRKEFGLDDQPIEKPQEQKTVQANDTESPNSSENKKVDDPVAAEPEANEQQSTTSQAPVKQAPIESGLDAYDAMAKSISDGELNSAEQIKNVLNYLADNQDSVKAELNKLNKKQLTRMVNGHVWSDTKKAELVNSAYRDMFSRFMFIGNQSSFVSSSSYKLEDKISDAKKHVESLTDQQVAEYSQEQKAKIDAQKERLDQYLDKLKNPQTLDDYKAKIKAQGQDSLTTEQQAEYDKLIAGETIASKNERPTEKEGLKTGGDVELGEPIEGVHGKTGDKIFNVQVISRLGKDAFKEAAAFARSMGGGYYRSNFYFKSVEDAELFSGWVNGEAVDTTANQEEKAAQRQTKTASRLKEMAERVEERANETLNADRKTNTIKRIGESERAISNAEKELQIASILRDIPSSDTVVIKNATQKVQVELLDLLSRTLVNAAPESQVNKDGNSRRTFKDNITNAEKAKHARIPLKSARAARLNELADQMLDKKGFIILGRKMKSLIKGKRDQDYITINDSTIPKFIEFIEKHASQYDMIRDEAARYKRLERMGITNEPTLRTALIEYMELKSKSEKTNTPNKLNKLEQQLKRTMIGNRNAFNDFFPTPENMASEIASMADIQPGMRVLEPSAGNGLLADAAREQGAIVDVVEMGGQLRDILSEKGFNIVGSDFLEFTPEKGYDRIVMNPPFSNDQDIKHVEHAYKMLNPGGKLVAITSSMAGDRSNKANKEFSAWLDSLDAEQQALPEGAFKSSLNPTNVNTKAIVIEKPSDAPAVQVASDVKFSKSKKPASSKSISTEQAQSIADQFVKDLKGANGITVSILDDTATAEKLWRMSLDGATVKGAYSELSKTVYIIAENINDLTDLKQTLAHETIAHGGLDTVIGAESKQAFIDRIKATKGRKAFEEYWKDANNDYWDADQDVKAEEIFARFVENEPSKGEVKYWWQALKRFIRAQLDKIGVAYREDDEVTAMRDMLESIVKGFKAQREPVQQQQSDLAYSQSDKKFSRTTNNDTSPSPSKISEAVKKVFNRESRFEKSSVPEWEALNAQLRETDKTAGEKIKRQLSRWFMPGGNLPETVQQAKRGRDRDVAVHEFDVSMLVGKLNSAMKAAKLNPDKLTDEQWAKYHQFLIGKNDGQALTQSERDTLVLMREHIDGLTRDYVASINNKLQQRLVEDGSTDPKESARLEKMLGNIGKYLNRSYKAFDDPKWFEKIPTKIIDDARTYLMKQYEKDGATIEEAQQKAQVTMNEMVKTGTAYDSLGAFIAESKLGSKDLSTLIPRKDISPEIRALLGEYIDPRVNYAKSVSKMSAMIANDKLLSTIRDMGINNFIFEKDDRPPNATVQLAGEKSEVYAPLNGMWTTPEIKEAFEDAMGGERGEGWLDKAIQINGFIKFGKTVLSPTTAMRNVMSAYFFTVANGHFNQKYMKQAVAAFNAQVKEKVTDGESDYIKRLIKLGVLYDSANAGDIVKVMTDGKINQMLEGRSGAAFENLRWLTAKATGFYRFGDDFWKIVGFENEKAALVRAGMKEGEAETLAAERIQDTYPTYSRVGKAGAWLSRFPLAGTFVSFPAEIIRTTGNMMKLAASEIKSDNPKIRAMGAKRIVGMSLASGGMFALSALSAAMFGVTDDEEEALRDLAPEWQKNSTFVYAGRDSDNNLRYFDMSFLDPYAYWKRPIEAMMRDQPVDKAIASSLSDMVSPFLGTDISTGKILEVISNKKQSGGQVYKENDTAIRKSADIAGHLALGLAPGAVNNAWRIGMAAGDVKRSTGKPYSLSDEMLALAGFRSSTFDPKVGLYYRTFDFNNAIAEARKELSGVLRDPNKVSDDEISAAKARAKTKQEQAFKQMSRLIKAAQTGGANRRQVVQILLLAGISKRNIGFLLREQVPPVNLSDRSFESAVKRAQLIMDNESAREVRSRFNRIIKND